MTVVHDTCADDVTIEEVGDLLEGTAGDVAVGNFQIHHVWLGMGILSLCGIEFLLLVIEVDAAMIPRTPSG